MDTGCVIGILITLILTYLEKMEGKLETSKIKLKNWTYCKISKNWKIFEKLEINIPAFESVNS